MEMSRTTTRDLTLIALFVAIIAVMAQITIPLPLVPLTLSTFAIPLAGVVLGARKGFLAACLYLLLGAVGVPVFSAFQGGFGMFIGPTGGYILSFPLIALIAGLVSDKVLRTNEVDKIAKLSKISYLWLALGLTVGMLLNLSLGMLQLALVMQIGIPAAFVSGAVPFLIPELLKIGLVLAIAPKIRQVIESRYKQ